MPQSIPARIAKDTSWLTSIGSVEYRFASEFIQSPTQLYSSTFRVHYHGHPSLLPIPPSATGHMWLNIGMNDVTKQVLITCYTVLCVLSQ